MIQFNLLPEVKIAFNKAERQKQLVITISTIASIAAIILFVLLFSYVNVAQKKSMNDLTKDIKAQNKDLMATKDLNKILTVQNQLNALDQLHGDKISAGRIFTYIQQTTPADVTISQIDVDYAANTISVNGNSKSLSAVNTYADALKFTKYRTNNLPDNKAAFKDVVLASFSLSDGSTPKYNLTLSYDPTLFAQTEDVSLVIPKMVTNRSNVERPATLFQQSEGNR